MKKTGGRTSRDTLPLRDFSDSFQCMMYSSWTLISNISGFSFFCSGECTGPFSVHASLSDLFKCMMFLDWAFPVYAFGFDPFLYGRLLDPLCAVTELDTY